MAEILSLNGEELQTKEAATEKLNKMRDEYYEHLRRTKDTIVTQASLFLESVIGLDLTGYEIVSIDFVNEQVRYQCRKENELHYHVTGIAYKQVPPTKENPKGGAVPAPYWDNGITMLGK